MKHIGLIILCLITALGLQAKVTPARLFESGMVLQRGKPIPVWGTADAGERFAITFAGKTREVVADASGHWRTDLPKMKAGGPYTMTIGTLRLDDILVGDVWLCSGQSNMDVTVERVAPQYAGQVETYRNDRVRLLRVNQHATVEGPQRDFQTSGWKHLTPADSWTFSALGYFLGRRLQEQTGVPQGIICNSWGGTPIEAWVPADSLGGPYSHYLDRRDLYTTDYVTAQRQANTVMDNRWHDLLDRKDPGLQQGWTGLEADDSRWPTHNQYDKAWAQVDGRGVVGSVWMRQHIHLDKAHAGRAATLLLGTLYDADYTFVNGKQVGVTYYQYPPRRYKVPEGLLREGDNVVAVRFVNKGGTPAFTPGKRYALDFGGGDVLTLSETWRSHVGALMPACPSQDVGIQNLATVMYNSMLMPVVPYGVAGVVWYQGESNTDRPNEYLPMLRKLKGAWRRQLGDDRLPFVVVQLANFMAPSAQPQETGWAQVREAQRLSTIEDDHSELAVAIDLGEFNDIHPLRKREVADRVALALGKLCYGRKAPLSPLVQQATATASAVTLRFDQPLQDGEVYEFELAGTDGRYHNAKAKAKGNTVTVTCEAVERPTRVRYAWKNNPDKANVRNRQGLPASPFQCIVEEKSGF